MKKLVLVAILLFVVFAGRSQAFEGSMKWSMKMDITDPAQKAKLEQAKKEANSPANQAKIKELRDKMNDPQFKQMLDANPQMKAQMESALKMMSGGGMESMMPSGIVVKLKGPNSLRIIEGGMMDNTSLLYAADKDVTYAINHAAKTYVVAPKGEVTQQEKAKVTKTSETAKILNYNCVKYIIEAATVDGTTATVHYWATQDIKDIDVKSFAKQQNKEQKIIYPEIEGLPMKIEVKLAQGNMIMEMVEFKRGGVSASDFVLPAGYMETKLK